MTGGGGFSDAAGGFCNNICNRISIRGGAAQGMRSDEGRKEAHAHGHCARAACHRSGVKRAEGALVVLHCPGEKYPASSWADGFGPSCILAAGNLLCVRSDA